MGNISPDPQTSLEQLRQRLQDAKVRYDFAKAYLVEVRQDFADSSIDGPVELLGYRKALRSEIEALMEYNRVLRAMADLALRGTVPESVAQGVGDSPIVEVSAVRHHHGWGWQPAGILCVCQFSFQRLMRGFR